MYDISSHVPEWDWENQIDGECEKCGVVIMVSESRYTIRLEQSVWLQCKNCCPPGAVDTEKVLERLNKE